MGALSGDSNSNIPAITGTNSNGGVGVWGTSQTQEGVHGETNSLIVAAVAGIQLNPNGTGAGVYGESKGHGTGVTGISQTQEGIHRETNSLIVAAIAGIQINPNGTGAGVYGENKGQGAGVTGISQNKEGIHAETNSDTFAAVGGIQLNPNGTGDGIYGENRGKGHGVFGKSQNWEGVHGETLSAVAAGVAGIQLNPNGTGAGVYGESQGKGPAGFFKGDVIVTGDVKFINADVAEDFDVLNNIEVEDGTLMVLSDDGGLQTSYKPYDKRIVGVISGAGSYKPAVILDKKDSDKIRKPIALVGKVYCKVDASLNPIEVGDLLTTSEVPGHAMKAADPFKAFGAVIGKALKSLNDGRGLIPILVALQ